MNLKRVTITGADDSTDISELVDLSLQYPFIEWGILVSKKQEGGPRFPSRPWIDRFAGAAGSSLNVSTHVCGRWVREMLIGDLDWNELPSCIEQCQRVQINTHAEPLVSTTGLIENLTDMPYLPKEFIFQWDGVNDHLAFAALGYGVKVSALFDTSGGAGILPKEWPKPAQEFWCGYAGGIGPQNIVEQVHKVEAICNKPYWVDMERRVRTDDDSALDMQKVRQVLKSVHGLLAE